MMNYTLQTTPDRQPLRGAWRGWCAAALSAIALAGCGKHDSRPVVATQVILPGEQHYTIPEAPASTGEAAEEETASNSEAASGSAAATEASSGNTPATSTTAATTPASQPDTGSAASTTPAASTGTDKASFTGRVTVDGTVPTLSPLIAKDDPKVKDAVCVAQAIPDDSIIVGEGGGLANVFVFAKKLPAGIEVPPAPTDPVAMDQQGCRFIPQALVFRVGQPLLMKNSDPVSHNVRTAGFTQQINQIISPKDAVGIPVKYARPERVPVQTKCDIHAWMLSYHLPLDHPYAAVTGPDGTFEIKDLPPGDWEFVVWHGRAGNIEKSVKFKTTAGQVINKDFSVKAADLTK